MSQDAIVAPPSEPETEVETEMETDADDSVFHISKRNAQIQRSPKYLAREEAMLAAEAMSTDSGTSGKLQSQQFPVELTLDMGAPTHEMVDGSQPDHGVITHHLETAEEHTAQQSVEIASQFRSCVVGGASSTHMHAVCAIDMLGSWLVTASARGALQITDTDEKYVVAALNAHTGMT
jgi:hypothetical protein